MTEALFGSQADWIALWRGRLADLGWTHRELDDRAGLGEGYASKLLCGLMKPTAQTIERINRALGISLHAEYEAVTP
jgi:transcriptional regulator with XRE-family HTH domain